MERKSKIMTVCNCACHLRLKVREMFFVVKLGVNDTVLAFLKVLFTTCKFTS